MCFFAVLRALHTYQASLLPTGFLLFFDADFAFAAGDVVLPGVCGDGGDFTVGARASQVCGSEMGDGNG